VAHGCHGKTKNLTAKTKTSRQNQKPYGKTKSLTAKPKASRQNQIPHGKTKNLTANTAKPNRAMAEVINTAEVTSSRLIRKEKQRQACTDSQYDFCGRCV